jgi:hypothetical protein
MSALDLPLFQRGPQAWVTVVNLDGTAGQVAADGYGDLSCGDPHRWSHEWADWSQRLLG